VLLDDYTGQNIRVEFMTQDCNTSEGTHFAYAYLDAECADQLATGIPTIDENPYLKIYPNPTNSSITGEWQPAVSGGQLTANLYDVDGKLLLKHTTNQTKFSLDISALSSGIYFIKITDGEQVVNRKIIKK
jgi:hypothetical protein